MLVTKILEARKNPAQNTKVGLLQSLVNLESTLDKLPNGKANGFISFSYLIKLGINPNPLDYMTPAGIYGYPIDYVISLIQAKGSEHPKEAGVPYAGDRPYIHVFSIKNPERVLFLEKGKLLDPELDAKIMKILEGDDDYLPILESYTRQKRDFPARGTYFLFQKSVSNVLRDETGARTMTKIMKQLGYDGIYDDGHNQIAYEPYQVVMFSKAFVEQHDLLYNNHVDLEINQRALYRNKVGATFVHNVSKDSLPYLAFKSSLESSRLGYVLRANGMDQDLAMLYGAKNTSDVVKFLEELNSSKEDLSLIGREVFIRSFVSMVSSTYYLNMPDQSNCSEWYSIFDTWIRNCISICRLLKTAVEMPNFEVSNDVKQFVDAKLTKFLKVYEIMQKLKHFVSSATCKKIVNDLPEMSAIQIRDASKILHDKIVGFADEEFFYSLTEHGMDTILTNAIYAEYMTHKFKISTFDSFKIKLFVEICKCINDYVGHP